MRIIDTTRRKIKFSYAVIMEPYIPKGNDTAILATIRSMTVRVCPSSSAVIVAPNILSVFAHSTSPTASAIIPMMLYTIVNVPNSEYWPSLSPPARSLAV